MNNRMRKVLSVLIAVLMIAVLLPTASLAGTQIHVFGVPDDVTNVEVYLKNDEHRDCNKPGGSDHWKGLDNGELVTGNINYVKLYWSNYSVNLPESFWDIDEEGEPGSGTLKLTLKAGWTGSLTITKNVGGNAAPNPAVDYSFTVTGPDGIPHDYTVTGGTSRTITDLTPGPYTVVENVPTDRTFTVDDVDQSAQVAAGQTAALTFTNTYNTTVPTTGTLTIRKHVEGEGAPAGDVFDFSIQMIESVQEFSVMAYAPFSLKDGEAKTYTNLRPGKYLVTETHWPDGYEPKSASKEVTVNAGENPEVLFTNYYTPDEPDRPDPTPTYTVSYHPNGGLGTVPTDMNRYYPGDKAWLKPGTGLYRPNYVFAGWSLIDGTRVNDPYTMGRSDVTFFAIWVPVKVPKTGDQATPYGLMMLLGAVSLAAVNLLRKRRHTAK